MGDVDRSGDYPELMSDSLRATLGSEAAVGHVVHQETTSTTRWASGAT